eukprot:TRINITY_DN7231_c0_g1_i1.p1 TRINITY_DN7231_c0_g1~~TRINITY_DN7231_c0_g1_i1.p1  ORF type:complete len:108 (-),score=8.14 TRINITY_DN7231_c0_g1_i1:146-469(-)
MKNQSVGTSTLLVEDPQFTGLHHVEVWLWTTHQTISTTVVTITSPGGTSMFFRGFFFRTPMMLVKFRKMFQKRHDHIKLVVKNSSHLTHARDTLHVPSYLPAHASET